MNYLYKDEDIAMIILSIMMIMITRRVAVIRTFTRVIY